MGKLNKNQSLAFNQAEKAINIEEKLILKIYQSSLKQIRSELLKLNERIDWSFNELNKFGRLQKLEEQMLKEIRKISVDTFKTMAKTNTVITTNTYNRAWFGYEKEIGATLNFDKIDPELVRQIVRDPYPGIKLSDMIKNIGVQQAQRIKFEIGQGLLQGEGIAKISKRIKDSLGIGYNSAVRIARTEGLRAQSKSALTATDRSKDLGIDVVKVWDATLDGRTRPTHRAADGQEANKKGDFTVGGVKFIAPRVVSENNASGNTARETINCRCSYLEEIKDVPETIEARASKQKQTIDSLTYQEWKKGKGVK